MPDIDRQQFEIGNTAESVPEKAAEDDDDDRSSSLSEPEDEPDEEELHNGARAGVGNGAPHASQRSLDVDSEAETEMLDQTPQKAQKYAEGVAKTPSKLSQAAVAEDELSDPPSPLPMGAGVASSTSTLATAGKLGHQLNGAVAGIAPNENVIGQKRKRSDTAESSLTSAASDLGESPRKPSLDMPKEAGSKAEEAAPDLNGTHGEVVEEVTEDAGMVEEASTPAPVPVKGHKGKKGKQKGRKAKEMPQEVETEQQGAAEVEQDSSEQIAAKTEELKQQRLEASSLFEELAKHFTAFREKLYSERLAGLTVELELLNKPDCQHPEYLRQVACVDARRDKQIREANAFYFYRTQSVRQRTLGDRSQLQSQYFQTMRDLRENVLYELGEDWHKIQRERRQHHQESDDGYLYKFPERRSDQIRRQAEYNQEVSILSGVAKHVGFPAAPEVAGAKGDGLEDDLRAMKVSTPSSEKHASCILSLPQIPKRVPRPQPQNPRQVLYGHKLPSIAAQSERLTKEQERIAHEQFIEQNAWAQPQRPVHQYGMPNLTHTDNWAEPGPHAPAQSARTIFRNLGQNLPGRTASPYTTPLPQKHTQPDHSSSGTVVVGSDGPEAPSSVLAPPPASDRITGSFHSHSTQHGSPLIVNKHRQNGTELTGFRNTSNMSGVSGVSTIDAPPDSAEKDRLYGGPGGEAGKSLPALLSEASAPQQIFDTSQMHRHHGDGRREVYPSSSFRPQEGAYGTPAPLQHAAGVPPG